MTVKVPPPFPPCLPPPPSIQSESLQLEAASWAAPCEAAGAGALLLAAWRHVWPLARQYRAKRAQGGLVLALSVGAGASLLRWMLCWGTPYCLS